MIIILYQQGQYSRTEKGARGLPGDRGEPGPSAEISASSNRDLLAGDKGVKGMKGEKGQPGNVGEDAASIGARVYTYS